MKRCISIIAVFILTLIIITSAGCNVSDKIDDGTYICKTPYIEYSMDSNPTDSSLPTGLIEIDRKVYKAFSVRGYDASIYYYEFQEKDLNSTEGWCSGDNELYARFNYKFDSEKKQLILKDKETGNVYHLDKVK